MLEQKESYLKKELYDLIKKDESIFEFFQDKVLDGIWYWDLTSPKDEWMSPSFWKNFGYDPETKKSFSSEWQDIIDQDDLKHVQDNFTKHCADSKYPFDQIVRYKNNSGGISWVRCRGVAIRDKDGKPIRMLGIHIDLTDLKKQEELLKGKIIEVNKLNKLMVGREMEMVKLKEELSELKSKK